MTETLDIKAKRYGHNLKRIRKNKGLSLKEFSHRAKVSPSTISQLEKGMIYYPTLETVKKIRDAFKINAPLFFPQKV